MRKGHKVEQLCLNGQVVYDYDEINNSRELKNIVCKCLDLDIKDNSKEIIYNNKKNKKYCIIPINISYLGSPHLKYKKRIQVGKRVKDIIDQYLSLNHKIIILGVYTYKDLTLFVDFDYDSYKYSSFNSSSFHVHLNDLYMGLKNNVFSKLDKNLNKITIINTMHFKSYLDSEVKKNKYDLVHIFEDFNNEFTFNEWIYIYDALPRMYSTGGQFRQTEWPGFYLENEFNLFIKDKKLQDIVEYVGRKNKSKESLDFDLYFVKNHFYGDLKSSDIEKKEVIGNDYNSFINCINEHKKLWYIIYEHETKLDKKENKDSFKGTLFRSNFISEKDKTPNTKPLSYKNRLKYAVNFSKMKIIELNNVNKNDYIEIFNQGKQPSGDKRNPKILLNKKILNDDNFVIYRYTREESNIGK